MIKCIITGGCSFSNGGNSTGWTGFLTRHYKKLNPDIEFIHTGYLSQGQELIQKKVMLNILEALDKGYSPEEILIIVMWSGTYRKTWYIDNPVIIQDIIKDMPKFNGGMCKQFLDLKDQITSDASYFQTFNGTKFEYNPNGGWYFTVNGSECELDFIKQHYLLDRNLGGVGKVHTSLENIIMLQNFCQLNNIVLIHQYFMDFVYQDIMNNKDHQIIGYLYRQLNKENSITEGMFEYIHTLMGIPREKAILISHKDRLTMQKDKEYFQPDGFHPGELGVKMWCENILLPFLKNKNLI